MTDMHCVVDAKASLGEGTCWDPDARCLWWLDIYGQKIHRYEPRTGETQSYPTQRRPGSLAVRAAGGLIVAMGDGFHVFDPATGECELVVDVEADIAQTRMNDGRTDRQGRFWSGSVFEVEGEPARPLGALHRLGTDRVASTIIEGITCFNGLAWSPDGATMYCTDSATNVVHAWDFDIASGEIANRRAYIDLSGEDAIGDGATVDAEGCYWLTLPFKGRVQRFDPAGRLMRTIMLPTDVPTCCEFGGDDLDILYVTTATLGRGPEELAVQPWAGALLAIDPGVRGLAACPFGG